MLYSSPLQIPHERRTKWADYLTKAEKLMKSKTDTESSANTKTLDQEVTRQLLEGHAVIEAVLQVKKVVRVFVSSTFTGNIAGE